MSSHFFVDTNILVYAHDRDAGQKRELAADLVEELFQRPYPPAISVQILNELYVNVLRAGSARAAKSVCESYTDWEVIPLSLDLFRGAVTTRDQYKISLWDGLVIEAARKARADKILSEDLSHGQRYHDIEVLNPFKLGLEWRRVILES